MSISDDFQEFLANIKIDNVDIISLRYGEITASLNKKFRDTESKEANSLQVGSYGRRTAIKGISDLDMIYIMPSSHWDEYKSGGQYNLLRDAKDAIKARYPSTTVRVDRLVVRVLYNDFHIEVQPAFKQNDGSYKYPDTNGDGSWKITKPQEEIDEIREADKRKNQNLRRLCKMARAWKNKHGVYMGGLLIDTLAYNFLESTRYYDNKSYLYYDHMSRDFFKYLSELPDQTEYAALGSRQRVKVKKKFQSRAKKAYDLCKLAINAEGQKNERQKWRDVFGNSYPAPSKSINEQNASQFKQTEEFIDERFNIDIRYNLVINCEVTQDGFRSKFLAEMLENFIPLKPSKKLRFFVVVHNLPGDCELYWKVLNRGAEAKRRDCIRGQIHKDMGSLERVEHTVFKGEHLVECYAVQRGVVIARDRISVPIDSNKIES